MTRAFPLELGSTSALPHMEAGMKMWGLTTELSRSIQRQQFHSSAGSCRNMLPLIVCRLLSASAALVPLVLCRLSEDLFPRNASSQREPISWGVAYMHENTGHWSDTWLFPFLPSKALRAPIQEQIDQKSKIVTWNNSACRSSLFCFSSDK